MNVFIAFVGWILVTIAISFVMALPVMLLWDAIMPAIFKLPEITWLQAWFLSLMCNFLFKSNVSSKNS